MIDIHAHLWPRHLTPEYLSQWLRDKSAKQPELDLSSNSLLASMKGAGIEKTVISCICFRPDTTDDELDIIHRFVSRQCQLAGESLAAFCTINPRSSQALLNLKKRIEDEGYRGLKLHPNMQEFFLNDPMLFPFYEQMEQYRLPILFHTGGIGILPLEDGFSHPSQIDAVASRFPNLPIIMGHAGRYHYRDTAMLLRKHPNVYADISTNFGRAENQEWLPLLDLMQLTKAWCGTTEKLLLGSDYPFYSQTETITRLYQLAGQNMYTTAVTSVDIHNVLQHNGALFCSKYNIFPSKAKYL